jgi:tetratricopeptide (TPR) repeat protein
VSLPLCLSAEESQNLPDFPQFIFWEFEYEQALKSAGKKTGFIFTYIYSNDCDWCQKMDEETLSHPEVIKFSRNHVFLKLNGDSNASKPFTEKYQIGHLPTFLVLSHSGEELYRESNYLDPFHFLRELEQFNKVATRRLRTDSQDSQSLMFYLDYAKKAFQHLEFMEATKALDYILYKDPHNKQGLNDEALLLFGTSLVYLYQLEAAEILLARLCLEFPQSRAVPDAMYILGEIYIQTNRTERGHNLLKKLIKEYPEHVMAQKAQMALERTYGRVGR